MFRKPRFPLPTVEKVRIEKQLVWLERRFGIEPIRAYSSLTSQSTQWQQWQTAAGTLGGIRLLRQEIYEGVQQRLPFVGNVCELIDWDGHSAVPRDPDIILLNPREQTSLEALLNRVASHLALRFIGSLGPQEKGDHDGITLAESLLVYFGFGVCAANMSLQTSQFTLGDQHAWHHQKYTESAARHFGVTLSYRVWLQGDSPHDLASSLRLDARTPFQKALSYLRLTGDTLFDPHRTAGLFDVQQVGSLMDWLWDATASQTAGVLQRVLDLTQPGSLSPDGEAEFLFRLLPELLHSSDASIRWLACRVADRFATVHSGVLEGLRDLLTDPDPRIRGEAVAAMIYGASAGEFQARDLLISLKDDDPQVVQVALQGLIYLRQTEEDLVPALLSLIRRSLNRVMGPMLDFLCAALDTVSTDAESHLREFLQTDNEEYLYVLQCLRAWRASGDLEEQPE